MAREADDWVSMDIARGLLLLIAGLFATLGGLLAARNGLSFLVPLSAWVVGPLLVLIGAHATYRGLLSLRRDEESSS